MRSLFGHNQILAFILLSLLDAAWAFSLVPLSSSPSELSFRRSERREAISSTALYSGTGIAKDYTWQEEAFEIDVTVKVPADAKAKHVQFHASPKSISLNYTSPESGDTIVLLDGNRPLRGRVSLDGTYWVIGDITEDKNMPLSTPFREVTVTIEKMIKTPKDDFEVVEYDWKGVYAEEYPEEVSYRKYDGPEELDIREYSASLGVDIDNLNMSMVDKTMFSSGLNLTQSSMDELTKAGLIEEVTQQKDGSEFKVNSETGEPEIVKKGSGQDEDEKKKIPFLDTNSPWHNAVPVNETSKLQQVANENIVKGESEKSESDEVVQQKRYFTRAAFAKDAASSPTTITAEEATASDPIDLLTVKKLKEILKSQGLKVSGNKKELQDRLRAQVNSLLQGGNPIQDPTSSKASDEE